ncbi:globin family protein [Thiocapsa sp.]|uniref:globin family protein n=1 Tax=Thiocapsa sp. TaxID=2024551 RepID=UPI002CF1CEB0|nr:globin family protein [Thiocapsa sp.]HSO82944.1 globin family protein [Thiocapsa sp.]
MNPETITLVKDSWATVAPISEQAAGLFYGRLFEIYPEVRPMFKGDMKEQGNKLVVMLTTVVNALDNLDPLIPTIKKMGARHAGYGVHDGDYAKVADALLWTLGQGLGDDFTPEVKNAWVCAYSALADTMKAGAAEAT